MFVVAWSGMSDVLVVGGGVIGLSLAYELAGHGLSVQVIDRAAPGQEASWAGAGILPPASRSVARAPLDQLAMLSHALHPRWSEELAELTGIDNGYRRCGGIYLARDTRQAAALDQAARDWQTSGVTALRLTVADVAELEPALAPAGVQSAFHLPDEAQIRNPRHLKALLAACAKRGAIVRAGVEAEDFQVSGSRLLAVATNLGPISAGAYCFTCGSWTRALLARLGWALQIKPIRGQMVLLAPQSPLLRQIINDGPRYLTPRADGRILAGSTEEDAGFDKRTTAGGVSGLLEFALGWVPSLATAQVERTWAGLRPATADGLPYLGSVSPLENAFVAAGHFRSGLELSPGTAVAMSRLIRGVDPQLDLAPFQLQRLGGIVEVGGGAPQLPLS